MKTPDEIKKGLDVCATLDGDCENCPYDGLKIFCSDRLRKDALAYIQRLEQELAAVKRERDAAVRDMAAIKVCALCRHDDTKDHLPFACTSCGIGKQNWRWRGVCSENTEV
jgi:hypothetical protein